ncbi:hypothetical protein N1851_007774 [Merluccius polli]|uniref:Uncharacterized protein n=1 Tax=Merluccius polli TaxID=89951 RepID=A0AA47P8A2_MERPO|nr:hypothetical protein N1851_007774 [Merluccius polli]
MALELCLLVYVKSLRQYIDALTELVPWFFAVVHTNYARWIPIHLHDMTELPTRHPSVVGKGRTFCELTPSRQNYSVSCPRSSFRCYVRKTRKLSSLMEGAAQRLQDLHTLAPCSHEEADSHILLHVSHAAQHGHHQMLIRTFDTDVVVLAVGCELWLAFGTGKSFRYLADHQIAACPGPEMSCALPMFHALTGCDTVSSFAGHGKKAAWSTWKSLPELTDALLMLANRPKEIPDDAMNIIERFVIRMFDRTSESCLPELLWWSMSREQSTRVVTSGGRHCYQTLCCHHQLTGGG